MRIYCGNISWATTEDELRLVFTPFGTVEEIQIPRDDGASYNKGYGFVDMPDAAAHVAIGALDRTQFQGRTIQVGRAFRQGRRTS